ncbi:UDP-N-acetylmuramate dehydrogenase [Maribacter aestuarii]|uniref:UDP-N-acetylmuramate dehydrogenase n=1 Tax=Maribacter aestuarii TaxID=1130723 RepID=UPI00248C9266|nr:UDP-N-acetylmuramate dehydrogenase [Maribacter aestuarii]
MKIIEDFSLKNYNTFGIAAKARFFVEITSIEELIKVLKFQDYPNKFILGGGSNMLLTQDIDALVIYVNIKGIRVVEEDENSIVLKAMAGENWHQLVLWTLDHGYGGLENLSLIPGNTGTAPIQNIGAYGVELKDRFVSCEALHKENLELTTFFLKDCQFGYRESFFKNKGRDTYVIVSVSFKLSKKNHEINKSYGAIEQELHKDNIENPTIRDISNAVIAIRNSKLPDPKKIGNSGSFFKNPIISKKEFEKFMEEHPEAPFYKVSEKEYKIPAGWLIEQCGFKGKRFGDAGVHKNQALVLVNYGNATGAEIMDLALNIIDNVKIKFGIMIVPEVNLIK